MLVRKELEPAQSRDWDVRATKAIEPLSKRARCHWGISEAMRSRKLADCASLPK
jgi:hypothetical protein